MRHYINLIEARMSLAAAEDVFAGHGVTVSSMSKDDLAKARRKLVLKLHQDGTLDHDESVRINTAYDDLSYYMDNGMTRSASERSASDPTSASDFEIDPDVDGPPGSIGWLLKQKHGGKPKAAAAKPKERSPEERRQSEREAQEFSDYREAAYDEFEKMGEPGDEDYEVWSYDGGRFGESMTLPGHPDAFREMAEKLLAWEAGRHKVRAILIAPHKNIQFFWLVYLDGTFATREIKVRWESPYGSPNRDERLLARLPAELDKISQGRELA